MAYRGKREFEMKLILMMLLLVLSVTLFAKGNSVVDKKRSLEWQDNIEHNELIWKLSRGYCSQLALGGFHDWRMPTKEELTALSKNKKLKKQFSHFENALYWSASPDKNDDLSAHTIYSGNGHDSISDKCDKYFAICVRDYK